jgi:hypothetical protein
MKPWLVYVLGFGAPVLGGVLGVLVVRRLTREVPGDTVPPAPEPVSKRQEFLNAAEAELGGPKDPDVYWREVAPALVSSQDDWCGGFILAVLHKVGLGRDIVWQVGKGFLFRLPTTTEPVPGDLIYIDQPNQHHAIFTGFGDDGETVRSIDANQPGETVTRRVRSTSEVTSFYSIEPLIRGEVVT